MNAEGINNKCYEGFNPEYKIPKCYIINKMPELNHERMKTLPDRVLFYMFYNQPHEKC